MVVEFTTVTPLMLKPVTAGVALTFDPATKLVPVRTTAWVAPRSSEFGEMDVRVVVDGVTTVNVTGPTDPPGTPGIVTLTFRAPSVAPVAIVQVAVDRRGAYSSKLLTVHAATAATDGGDRHGSGCGQARTRNRHVHDRALGADVGCD